MDFLWTNRVFLHLDFPFINIGNVVNENQFEVHQIHAEKLGIV